MKRCFHCGYEGPYKRKICPNCGYVSNLVDGPAPWWLRLVSALLMLPVGFFGSCVAVGPIIILLPTQFSFLYDFPFVGAILIAWGFDRLLLKRETLRRPDPDNDIRQAPPEHRNQRASKREGADQ